jgi:hypothetical protein
MGGALCVENMDRRQVAEFIPEHVPLILETPVPEDRIESEMDRVREALRVFSLAT